MLKYLISGATGYIGSLLVKKLYEDIKDNEFVTCILLVRNVETAKKYYKEVLMPKREFSIIFVEWDMLDNKFGAEYIFEQIYKNGIKKIDYIVHCAAVTSSQIMLNNPVEVSKGIINGTQIILDIAKNVNPKHMVCLSSMEAYGVVEDIGRPRREEELGLLDLESARNCYPLAKRMQEHFCYTYYREYGVPVSVARLAQTFGKGIRKEDNRVYMQFARAVRDKVDIVLKTAGKSYGNYCSGSDVIDAIFLIISKGIPGECYNVVNEENTMSIREMAELVVDKISNGEISVRIDTEDESVTGYAKDTKLRMSGEKLRDLGWSPKKTIIDMYMEILEEII